MDFTIEVVLLDDGQWTTVLTPGSKMTQSSMSMVTGHELIPVTAERPYEVDIDEGETVLKMLMCSDLNNQWILDLQLKSYRLPD